MATFPGNQESDSGLPATDESCCCCFCNVCQRDNSHTVVAAHSMSRTEGEGLHPRIIEETWSIVQCGGCGTVTVIREMASTDFKTPQILYLPSRERRRPPVWLPKLGPLQQSLLLEIYSALHSECHCLATMGTRALLDDVFSDFVEDTGGFEQKLAKVFDKGLITKEQRVTIEIAIEAGHAASHRGFSPTTQQLEQVLDIVEHVLKDRYVMPDTSRKLASDIPQRQKGGNPHGA